MKNIYIFRIAILLLLSSLKGHAQQDPGYTQYMYNPLVINSAYSGSTGSLEAIIIHRSQWVGIEGAPSTQSFTVHGPLKNEKIGIGLSAVNDRLGPSNELYLDANVSYTINVGYATKLAFGIKAGARMLNVDWSKGRYYDDNDNLFNSNINNKFAPSLGAAAYLYTDNWYVGASVPSFLQGDYYDDIQESVEMDRMHFYLIGGYVFDLSENLKFKPATMLKGVSGAPLSIDISANFMIQEKFTAGLGYRPDDSVSGLVGFQISPQFFFGYAYDYTTSELSKYSDGTHEFMLRYQFVEKSSQIKSPRFF